MLDVTTFGVMEERTLEVMFTSVRWPPKYTTGVFRPRPLPLGSPFLERVRENQQLAAPQIVLGNRIAKPQRLLGRNANFMLTTSSSKTLNFCSLR